MRSVCLAFAFISLHLLYYKPERQVLPVPLNKLVMDATTLFNLIKPHLETMKPTEKRSFSQLIRGSRKKRQVLSLSKAKEKLRLFRSREMMRERA